MQGRFSRICVIGLGYIGLPTAAAFALRRLEVVGVDTNPAVVDSVNRGQIHIVEPELDLMVRAAVAQGHLRASLVAEPADAFLIAVPTPLGRNHQPDLSFIRAAAESVAPVLRQGSLVILESTSPVGTTEQLADWFAAARPDLTFPQQAGEEADVRVAYCPERVLPGRVIHELVENDRIIGGLTRTCAGAAAELYRIFVRGRCIATDARTAEMCKLTENAYRDVNIAFANELSLICDTLGIDVWELIRLANHHPRVNILQPGCGVGGHCIAVDPWFIVERTPDEAQLIRTAREVNNRKPHWVLGKVDAAIDSLVSTGRERSSITVAILGLAFKPDIDDLRESPALEIANSIVNGRAVRTLVVEPNISRLPASLANNSGSALTTLEDALSRADLLVLLVAHSAFAGLRMRLGAHQVLVSAVNVDSK